MDSSRVNDKPMIIEMREVFKEEDCDIVYSA